MTEKEPRKIIQIAASEDSNWTTVFALCNDGTVWQCETPNGVWKQYPQIPQD